MVKKNCDTCGGNGNMASDCGRCKRNPDIEDNWISKAWAKKMGY